MKILFIDPGVNSAGVVLYEGSQCILARPIVTTKLAKPTQFCAMASAIRVAVASKIDKVDLTVYEEPNLSGRFLSRSQRTMDRFIGALHQEISQHLHCKDFIGIHPMTLKAFFQATKTDKLDMAIKAGQMLPAQSQEILAEAIRTEAFDVTDAFALAAKYFQENKSANNP